MIVALTISAAMRVATSMRPEDEREIRASVGPSWEPVAWSRWLCDLPGVAYAIVGTGGVAVAMGGLAVDGAGRGSAWFVATRRLGERWARVDAHRLALRLRRDALRRSLHRVTVVGIEGRPDVHRWLRRLGFAVEGTHPGMGAGGETFRTYGWLPDRPIQRRTRVVPCAPEVAHADAG